jgi:hypothetical protein
VVRKLVDDAHRNTSDLRDTKKKTVDMLEKDSLKEEKLNEDVVNEAVEDVPSDESWVEQTRGKTAPIEKSGSSEISKDTRSKRFSKEHAVETPETSYTEGETDSPADEVSSE